MRSGTGWRAARAPGEGIFARRCGAVLGLVSSLGAAGCAGGSGPGAMTVAMRGPAVAFESIDGPPAPVFERLVGDLAAEADARQVQVVSRESAAAYRVRGYLAANVIEGRTHFDWAWDIYDADNHRTLRIAGDEPGPGKAADAWASLDDQTLSRIARASMDRLVSFLGSPDVAAPRTPRPSEVRAFAAEAGRTEHQSLQDFDPVLGHAGAP